MHLLMLAVEAGGEGLDLVGQLKGYGVAIFSIALFCGSVYLVLATDVGSRLGFMVAFSALTGFLMLLGLIWFTNLTPLNALHGPAPQWQVQEIVEDPSAAQIEAVREIEEEGRVLSEAEQGEIKASVDTAVTSRDSPFVLYNSITDYVVVEAESIGGGKRGLLGLWHKPLYAVMAIQEVKDVEAPVGEAPPPPEADPTKPPRYVVLERDLGALRQPPLFMTLAFGILFAVSLVVMHRNERAKQLAERAGSEVEQAPAEEKTPEPTPA